MSALPLLARGLVITVLDGGFVSAWRCVLACLDDLGRRLTTEEAHELANAVVLYGESAGQDHPCHADDYREAAKDLAGWIRSVFGGNTFSYGPPLVELLLKWPSRG